MILFDDSSVDGLFIQARQRLPAMCTRNDAAAYKYEHLHSTIEMTRETILISSAL